MRIITKKRPHRVACLVFNGVNTFELGTVGEVFATMHPDLEVPWWYSLTLCTENPGPVRTAAGFDIDVPDGLDAIRRADTVIVPSSVYEIDTDAPPAVARELRRARDRGARIASICTGAFTLASSGLLDGLEATTHWRFSDQFAQRFPAVTVRPRVLYVDYGRILTSAGVAAGVDLCLHLVRHDHGPEVASRLANWMVVAAHREGGQAQFFEQPVTHPPLDDPIAASVNHVRDNLDGDPSVEALARVALLSSRQFERRFNEAMAISPGRWVVQQRIRAARDLLAGSDAPVEVIAERVGMSPAGFRANFKAEVGISPAVYRRQHQEQGPVDLAG